MKNPHLQRRLLSINVNKIATLRNSRGGDVPHLLTCVHDLIRMGAQGITVHPRPDERHIKYQDVLDIHKLLKKINRSRKVKIEFNIEGYPSPKFLHLVSKVRPDQVTLVPDKPNAITSNAGWDLSKNKRLLAEVVRQLNRDKMRVSLFVDVFKWSKKQNDALIEIAPQRVELYTEKYAHDYPTPNRVRTTNKYRSVAKQIYDLGFLINAGHDLNLDNLNFLIKNVPTIIECSIGHAFMADSLYMGFSETLKRYLKEGLFHK